MALFRTRTIVGELEDLLEKERVLILRGDLSGVFRLAREKERLLTKVMSDESAPALEHLRGLAERNNALLASAARGIKRVTEHLRSLEDAQGDELKTYGRDGASHAVGTAKRNLTKRA